LHIAHCNDASIVFRYSANCTILNILQKLLFKVSFKL
jgi:hypothetical protein